MNAWAESMRRIRNKRKLSLRQLAQISGVTYSMICRYETGKQDPGLFNLVCLADALGIGLDEYIGRKKP